MSDVARGTGVVRPVFVDNRDGNTLARAITTYLAALRRAGRAPTELCVASCYFNPQGLELIAGEARHVPRIRLRLLECSEERPRVLSEEMALAAYESWTRARRSIFDAWTFETDPATCNQRSESSTAMSRRSCVRAHPRTSRRSGCTGASTRSSHPGLAAKRTCCDWPGRESSRAGPTERVALSRKSSISDRAISCARTLAADRDGRDPADHLDGDRAGERGGRQLATVCC